MIRISEDATWLSVAGLVAMRGTCSRLRVGALLVRDGRPISSGWNGAPSGLPHCNHSADETLEDSCENSIHAERNVVGWAARAGISTEGAVLYCTHLPCWPCSSIIIAAGIRRVVYREEYRSARGGAAMERSGIIVQRGCIVEQAASEI